MVLDLQIKQVRSWHRFAMWALRRPQIRCENQAFEIIDRERAVVDLYFLARVLSEHLHTRWCEQQHESGPVPAPVHRTRYQQHESGQSNNCLNNHVHSELEDHCLYTYLVHHSVSSQPPNIRPEMTTCMSSGRLKNFTTATPSL